jgi:hypothetical protein
MQKLAKLAGYQPEVEIAPATTGIFCRILFHLKVLLDLVNMAWFGVVDSTKFSIVAYGGNWLSWLVANRK